MSTYLMHHGIKGQRWGVRRYQNPDGSYTELGLSRLNDKEKEVGRRIKEAQKRNLANGGFRESTGANFDATRKELDAVKRKKDSAESSASYKYWQKEGNVKTRNNLLNKSFRLERKLDGLKRGTEEYKKTDKELKDVLEKIHEIENEGTRRQEEARRTAAGFDLNGKEYVDRYANAIAKDLDYDEEAVRNYLTIAFSRENEDLYYYAHNFAGEELWRTADRAPVRWE